MTRQERRKNNISGQNRYRKTLRRHRLPGEFLLQCSLALQYHTVYIWLDSQHHEHLTANERPFNNFMGLVLMDGQEPLLARG